MADNIAKLNVLISATATPMDAGLDGAIAKIGQFRDAVCGVLGTAAGSLAGAAGGVGTILSGQIGKGVNQIGDAFKGVNPLVTNALDAVSKIPGPVGIVGQAVSVAVQVFVTLKDAAIGFGQAVVDAAERGMDRLREMNRISKITGFSLLEAAGVQGLGAAIGDPTAFTRGMIRLRHEMQAARQGSVEAMVTLRELGVSFESIDAGRTAVAFGQVADAVRDSNDQLRTGAAVHRVFGRADAEMLGVLARGSEVFVEAQVRALRFGASATAEQMASITAANAARQRMAADWASLFAGVQNKLAIALAPAWGAVASGFDTIITRAQPALEGLFTVIDAVGKGVRSFVDGLNAGLEAWGPGLDAASRAFWDIGQIVSTILLGSDNVAADWRDIGSMAAHIFVEELKRAARWGLEIAATVVNIWQGFRGIVSGIDSVVNGLREAYSNARQLLMVMAAMDPTGNLTQMAGQLPVTIGEQSNLAGRLRDMRDVLRQIDDARARLESGMARNSTFVMLERAFQRGQAMMQAAQRPGGGAGGVGIDAGVLQAAMNAALQAPQLPRAISAGSAEAISAMNRASAAQESRDDRLRRMADAAEDQLRTQQEQRDLTRDLLRILEERGLLVQPANMPG